MIPMNRTNGIAATSAPEPSATTTAHGSRRGAPSRIQSSSAIRKNGAT